MKHKSRTSIVDQVKVHNVGLSSVLKCGDTDSLRPVANVFAVQRQVPVFWGNEGDLKQYPSFSRDIPVPSLKEEVSIKRENVDPTIRVDTLFLSSLSGSGILHIGSVREVETRARVKHIRHFIEEEVQSSDQK